MSEYPSFSRTTEQWNTRSDMNRERLSEVLQALHQCEVMGKSISSFLSALASRVDRGGDICSLAEERMTHCRMKRRSVNKAILNPWMNEAKGKLDDSQRGLQSTSSYLDHRKGSSATFSAFLTGAQENQMERIRRIEMCEENVTSFESTIRQIQGKIEAWDEI